MDAEAINAFQSLLKLIYDILGPYGVIAVPVVALLWFGYREWKESRETNALVEEKEKSIQRLANENRELRTILYRRLLNFSEEEVFKHISRNDPRNGSESRQMLEGPDSAVVSAPRSGDKKAPTSRRKK